MSITDADLSELKQMYLNRYQVLLTDEETRELARRLVMLFGVIGKKLPEEEFDNEHV